MQGIGFFENKSMSKNMRGIPIKWANPETQLFLARLLIKEEVSINKSNRMLVEVFSKPTTGWLTRTTGKAFLTETGEIRIRELLLREWPEYEEELADILREYPDFNFSLKELERYRIEHLPNHLPPQRPAVKMIRQSYNAIVGLKAKQDISDTKSKIFPEVQLVSADSFLRFRADEGLEMILANGYRFPIAEMSKYLSEFVVHEWDIVAGVKFAGVMPRAILIVENTGAFKDLPKPEGLFMLLIPGWNSPLALQALKAFPSEIPVWHFGDLDVDGYRMYLKHEKELPQKVHWFIPSFMAEYLNKAENLQGKKWPGFEEDSTIPLIVHRLATEEKWLEQEVCCLDKRMPAELEKLLDKLKSAKKR